MHYLAKKDGRIQKTQWIYIDDPSAIFKIDGVLFCPGVSNKSGMKTYTMAEAAGKIDAVALYDYLDWKVAANQARRSAAEKCEILVPDHLPLKYFKKQFPDG
jgi:hypothetical protein